MRCFVTVVLAGLLGLIAVGCDPFETEITLNADGSGKMVQRCQLSPAAFMFCKDLYLPAEGGPGGRIRLVSSDEMAKTWTEAHADGPVKIASYSCKRDDNGWRTIACEVTFSDLSKLAATEWGWPLGLSAATKDGRTDVRFSNPVRCAFAPMARQAGRGDDETAAMLQMGASLTGGMRTRVVWKLPAPALGAEGAQLSEDRKTVTYEATIGEGVEKFKTWWDDKTAFSVFLPADGPVKPFAQPPAPVVPFGQPAAAPKTVAPTKPPTDAKDFEFRLSQVSRNQSVSYNSRRPGDPPTKHENISINFNLFGPEGVDISRTDQGGYGPDRTPSEDLLSALKDGDGKDLRSPDTQIQFNLYGSSWRNPDDNKAQYNGNLTLSMKPRPDGSKTLALVEGYVVAEQTVETGKLEVKPLKDNLEKDFPLPGGVLRFTSIEGKKLEYIFTPKDSNRARIDSAVRVSCFGPDGTELRNGGASSNGDGKKWTMTRSYDQPLPDGAYAVVTYPVKVQQVKLPFKAENLQLP